MLRGAIRSSIYNSIQRIIHYEKVPFGLEQGEFILLSDPLSEEYFNPLYEKYWDDPSFSIKKKDGKNFIDIQYALVQN